MNNKLFGMDKPTILLILALNVIASVLIIFALPNGSDIIFWIKVTAEGLLFASFVMVPILIAHGWCSLAMTLEDEIVTRSGRYLYRRK